MRRYNLVILLISTIALFSGCGENTDSGTLTIGLMPAVDSAPFLYAEKEGYFDDAGIAVEITVYTNAQNRQTALQTNQIDGAMTDLVALIINRNGGFPIKGTISTDGSFPLLINPNADNEADPVIATMEISVANYLVSRYMEGREYTPMFIPEIPVRLEAVVAGKADMGLFPEPVASIGELQGLEKRVYRDIPEESLDLMVFTEKALKEKRETLKIFHRVYGQAAAELAADDSLAREILIEYFTNIPPAVRDELIIPSYSRPSLPSQGFTQHLVKWTAGLTGTDISVHYSDLFDTAFVPE